MRESRSAWLRLSVLVALITSVIGCSLSLRGLANPGGPQATPTPFVAGGPPTVEIASRADGLATRVGQVVDVDVRGGDAWPIGINRLELFAGNALVDRVITAGGASRQAFDSVLEWTPTAPGTYALSAYAYRADGTPSAPATISVIVTGQAISTATPTIVPLPTDSGSASPTDSLIPTVTLSPSPPPTPKPTPSPTPVPIGVYIDVWVEPVDATGNPAWTVGVRSILVVHVVDCDPAHADGCNPIPYVKVTATLAGATARGRTGSLNPLQQTTLNLALTPLKPGNQLLRVVGTLPAGYFETDPTSNALVWQATVTVIPAATPTPAPTPTPTPTAGP